MAMQKSTQKVTAAPARFRDVTLRAHVADQASGTLSGKLVFEFLWSDGRVSTVLEDVPGAVMTEAQRDKLRSGLRVLLEHALGSDGFVGSMDTDPEEPV